MTYEKPEVVAQNAAAGSYAAGCPANKANVGTMTCKSCERTAQCIYTTRLYGVIAIIFAAWQL